MTRRNIKPLLVYPPITKYERYSSAIGAGGGQQIPLGVYYLAAYIRQEGFETDVIDAEALDMDAEGVIQRLERGRYNVLGISTTTVAFHRSLDLARKVKSAVPDAIIVIGGPHVSCQPRQSLEFEDFDFAVRNEGEVTFSRLLSTLRDGGSDFDRIDGLVYRLGAEIVVNPKRPYVRDIDSLPMPAYDLISDMTFYTPPPSNYQKSPVANVITSRGCPSQCTFCDHNTFGRQARLRSAENVVDEIELLVKSYGIKEIAFVDDTFTLGRKRIYAMFEMAKSMGLHFPWTCMARIDTVDYKLLHFMKENGCWHISFGIESGNQDILRLIKKNIKIEDIRRVVGDCHRLGILTKGFFMVGHPDERVETIDESIVLATSIPLDDIVVTINTPMPGSYQFEHAQDYGSMDLSDWAKFNYWNPVFVPLGLSRELLLRKHREFYRRFYLRPQILWRYFLSFFSRTGLRRFKSILLASRFLFQPNRSSGSKNEK